MIDINKNPFTVIRVAKQEWKGEKRIDIREHIRSRAEGEIVPTKKGINVTPDLGKQVLGALESVLTSGK